MSVVKSHPLLLAAALAVATLIAWPVLLSGNSSHSSSAHTQSLSSSGLPQTLLQNTHQRAPAADLAALAHRFALISRPPQRMPAWFRARVAANMGSRFQLLDLSYTYLAHAREASIWVAYGADGGVCIFLYPKGSLACEAVTGALKRGVFLGVGGPPRGADHQPRHYLVVGLVPNNVKAVVVETFKGAKRTVPVHENAFSSAARETLTVAKLLDADGTTVNG